MLVAPDVLLMRLLRALVIGALVVGVALVIALSQGWLTDPCAGLPPTNANAQCYKERNGMLNDAPAGWPTP